MKRFLAGVLVGVVLTLAGLAAWLYWQGRPIQNEVALLANTPAFVESYLEGSRVLDVSVSPDSKEDVNYVFDKLYDVHVSYERGGKIKSIDLPFGIYQGTWIVPSKTDLALLDDKAKVLRVLSTASTPPTSP